MASCTTALPVPLAADVILIHGALLAAVHPQLPAVVMFTLSEPPAGSIGATSGLML
jgi:hypothetical protein